MEYKDKKYTYLGGLVHGISTLATGMKTSIKVYFRKKVTEQYPENRKELKMFDRFRGTLNMPHNENNEHRCVACGLCQMACPNDTIKVTSETVETEDGKKKKILATYEYDLGACMFCQLCVNDDCGKFGYQFYRLPHQIVSGCIVGIRIERVHFENTPSQNIHNIMSLKIQNIHRRFLL